MSATYDPTRTEHRQAAARCGLRIKTPADPHMVNTILLIDETTGEIVFNGPRVWSWHFMRDQRGLQIGSH